MKPELLQENLEKLKIVDGEEVVKVYLFVGGVLEIVHTNAMLDSFLDAFIRFLLCLLLIFYAIYVDVYVETHMITSLK